MIMKEFFCESCYNKTHLVAWVEQVKSQIVDEKFHSLKNFVVTSDEIGKENGVHLYNNYDDD